MFRKLTAQDEENFRQYARTHVPELDHWEIYHPVCREEWTKLRMGPAVDQLVETYRFVIKSEGGEVVYLATGTLGQAKQIIELFELVWGMFPLGEDEETTFSAYPDWFKPIAKVWDGCDIFALNKDSDIEFYYADGWEDFDLDSASGHFDEVIPSEDEP